MPELLLEGADTVIPDKDGIWAYSRDLSDPGPMPSFTRQALLRVSWSGQVTRVLDATDTSIGETQLRLGVPRGGRLVFLEDPGSIVELSPGKLKPLTPPVGK